MKIVIELLMRVNGNKVIQSGELWIKKDEINTALEFYNQIKRQYPYEVEVLKVTLSNEDITEEFIKRMKAPL